jgi:phage/plasmid-like protein (TIGR03299 family)
MAHNLDMTNGRANIAFMGSRKDVWHRMGQEMQPGQSIEQWATAAGLDWNAIKVPAMAALPSGEMRRVDGTSFLCRDDNGSPLGYVSGESEKEGYQTVQPRQVLQWFSDYISHDDRFQLDVAGSLKGGQIVWATATFNGPVEVAGDKHVARLLMTTSYDTTMATINQATMTRTVCNNTLKVATADKRAVIRTRHSGKFDAKHVRNELAGIAQAVEAYKAMGDAMAQVSLTNGDLSQFFKSVLDIPFDAKEADISTRKLNQFQDLRQAYRRTVDEGTPANTSWTALNAVTRYVDHTRSARGSQAYGGEEVARFMSANFGSGDNLKNKAAEILQKYQGHAVAASVPVPAALAAMI